MAETTTKTREALLVDDDPLNRNSVKRALEDRGYKVSIAVSPEDCKKYKDEKFDIAIIDGLEGKCFEVYNTIQAERKVILTGDLECLRCFRRFSEEQRKKYLVFERVYAKLSEVLGE